MLIDKFKLLLITLLLIVPSVIFTRHLGGSALEIPSNIITWFLMSLFVCVSAIGIIQEKRIRWSKNSTTLFLFFFLISLTYLLNHGLELVGFQIFLAVLLSCLFFISLQQYRFCINSVLSILILLSIYHACLAYSQLFNINSIASFFYISTTNRVTSTFLQPNIFAVIQVIGIAAVTMKYLEKRINIKLFLPMYIFLAVANFISYSRTGALSIFCIFIYVMFLKKNDRKFIMLFLISNILAILLAYYFLEINNKITNKVIIGDPVRFDLYVVSFKIFFENWLCGFGYGDFSRNFFFHMREVGTDNQYLLSNSLIHPHNEILYWTLMGGILNLIGIFYLTWKVIKDNLKYLDRYLILFVPILVNLFFEQAFINFSYLLFLFLFFIAILERNGIETTCYNIKYRNLTKRILINSLIIVSIIITFIGFHGIYSINYVTELAMKKNVIEAIKSIDKIGTPLMGKELFENTLNVLIYNAAIKTKNDQLINESINYWEKKVNYLPSGKVYIMLANLYYVKNDAKKLEELDVKARYYINMKLKYNNEK